VPCERRGEERRGEERRGEERLKGKSAAIYIATFLMKRSVFWDIPPCCIVKVSRCFGSTHLLVYCKALLAICFVLVSYLADCPTMKTEAVCSSETSVAFHRTTLMYNSSKSPL
jgi:hypothetical protein